MWIDRPMNNSKNNNKFKWNIRSSETHLIKQRKANDDQG